MNILEEPKARSTYENALLSKDIVKDNAFNSAIIVTSNYHSLRSKFTFEEV
ncbi:YdcF family protein [Halobacillus sp. Marseille-Q1614]|uniref:YdcF family protein n=1 Tax=Halobacillus sp. Marseille-Q1614 TaxID=2709134 RepID=UPI00156EF440